MEVLNLNFGLSALLLHLSKSDCWEDTIVSNRGPWLYVYMLQSYLIYTAHVKVLLNLLILEKCIHKLHELFLIIQLKVCRLCVFNIIANKMQFCSCAGLLDLYADGYMIESLSSCNVLLLESFNLLKMIIIMISMTNLLSCWE